MMRAALARRQAIIGGGAVAAGVTAGSGLAWVITGHLDVFTLLASTAVLTVLMAILNAAVAMYEARQETLRMEIECQPACVLAAALASCFDDTHARPPELPGVTELQAAARARARARQLLADMAPTVTIVFAGPDQACAGSDLTADLGDGESCQHFPEDPDDARA